MKVSGWCSAPDGARPMCGGCRVLDCEHECHEKPVVERDSSPQGPQFETGKRYAIGKQSGPDQRELIEADRPLVRSDRQ